MQQIMKKEITSRFQLYLFTILLLILMISLLQYDG